MIRIDDCRDFEAWRNYARDLLKDKIHFEDIDWAGEGFSFGDSYVPKNTNQILSIPAEFIREALIVSAFRDPSNWSLLYRLAYRLIFENKNLLKDPLDPDVQEFEKRHRLVKRDMHKMKAFVRFREVKVGEETHYFSWHRPDHNIIQLIAPFFRDRFNGIKWVIMTEDGCAAWDGVNLEFSPGVLKSALPDDESEDLWKTYYTSIFNPARIKEKAMKKEMPVRYWNTLPETELISSLMKDAPERLKEFYESQKVSAVSKSFGNLSELSRSLDKCSSCGICSQSNGPVSGTGPEKARIMIVGEQPGDEEDKTKKPFQGPSGQLLDDVLRKSGFRREDFYVTNAVKGFKHVIINSFRKHRTAMSSEITACRPWLREEMKLVSPQLVICLGRTAAQSVLGKMVKMEEVRGKVINMSDYRMVILPHPASLLRSQDEDFETLKERYVQDFLKLKTLVVSSDEKMSLGP